VCYYDKILVNVVAYVIPGQLSVVFLFTPHHSCVLGLHRRSLTCVRSTLGKVDHFANQVSKAELRDIMVFGIKSNLFTYHYHYVT